MATEKRLGATIATTNTALYTVPASTSAIVNMVQVCNRGTSPQTFRVAWVDGAIGDVSNEDYLYYDVPIPANQSICLRLGLTMETGHTILVWASHADVNFVAAGIEKSTT